MKKFFSLVIALMAMTTSMQAQNVQLHYDLGHSLYDDLSNRQSVTTTVEMFKPDKWGSTFLFTDIDYKKDGTIGAYWEIAREFNLTQNKQWAAHVEYNGGAGTGEAENGYSGNRYQHAFLAGGAWNWHSQDFSKTFSVQLMYKYYFVNHHTGYRPFSGFQLTEVWGLTFAKGLCTFDGFADLWYDPNVNGKLIFLTEPQFWVNMNKLKGWDKINLSLGTEVEISNNFVWNNKGKNNKFYAIPTIAAKWTF
ncbi:hypothetical protein HMPREF2136_05685 [Prevotella bivia DNF00650]|uniref:nucleoside-specific channel-forming Tsx family protein n=1 Tax=Prevotella bivia TaxID=28125 RepID=UPI00050ECE47|nr:DUF5020 family protein [Prevotella bivia]KGF37689.1 hypothetical protein HMPREF2136_05685 [Prevotella bivia DNF00650]